MANEINFFDLPQPIALGDICSIANCNLLSQSDAPKTISSVAPIEAAGKGALTFISNAKYIRALSDTGASAVICSQKHAEQVPDDVAVLVSAEPYRSFALAMAAMFPSGMRPLRVTGEDGVSDNAYVASDVQLEDGVTIEAGAVVGAGASIGAGSHIGPNAVIGANVSVGRNCSVAANATVLHAIIGNDVIIHSGISIGNDGFGFSMGPGGHLKIPQIGRVIIQDGVEIGANSAVDRGANRDTIIGEGTKIDNLVMIGHNVVIGRHCIIVGQTGIAGSATLEDYVVLGGKTAVNGHVKIGMGAQIAGLSGVSEDVPPGVQYGGVPARPIKHWMREIARLRREARKDGKKE